MSTPAVVIVTGSFALPEFYDDIVADIRAKSITVTVPHLPSVGLKTGPRPGPPPTMADDAALIAGEIKRLADEGRDVIVVSHSYGGLPATESIKGLSKAERRTAGKPGGVVRLAYMTALVAEVGRSAKEVLDDVPPERRQLMSADVS
jgi:alpha-beta hydrolase superfamily lysophospholipase